MNTKLLYGSVILSAVAGGALFSEETPLSSRPNLIYILTDDMGVGDLSALNPESKIRTPNMDRLAEEGRIFTDAHSCSAVCTPSRYGILTGNYDFRSGLPSGVLGGYDPPLIPETTMTIGDLYQQAGYRTACIGKWHLGLKFTKKDETKPLITGTWNDTDSTNVNFSGEIGGGPEVLGFDFTHYFPASLDIPPYIYISQKRMTGKEILTFPYLKGEEGSFMRSGAIAYDFDPEKVLPDLVKKSIEFMSAAQEEGKPFFLYLALPSPHTPYLPDEESTGMSQAGEYGDYVVMTDSAIGTLLNYLDKTGETQKTWIILTSDNGAWMTKSGKADFLKSTYRHATNGIYYGQKSDLYEGGHRVPLIMRFPQQIPAGTNSREPISLVDLFATAAAVLNIELPHKAALDSIDMSVALWGEEDYYGIRDSLLVHSINGDFALIKKGWKYLGVRGSGGWTKRVTAREQLYHLEVDVQERRNLRLKHPQRRREMKSELETILKSERTR